MRLCRALHDISLSLSLDEVLQQAADLSRDLIGAEYAAVAVFDERLRVTSFITSGLSEAARERIGSLPVGRGVLGVAVQGGKPLRLHKISEHPASVGFPSNHPPMDSFLGAPIVLEGRPWGHLYLTNKIGAPEFSETDELIATLFARQCGAAIQNARRYTRETRRNALLSVINQISKEMQRITDLDTLIQETAYLAQLRLGHFRVAITILPGVLDRQAREAAAPAGGAGHDQDPLRRHWRDSLLESARRSKEPIIGRYLTEEDAEEQAEAAAIPILLNQQVLGVLLAEDNLPNHLDGDTVKALETVADQLAVAIEGIRLARQQRLQMERLAVADERERFSRDLHDGVIQSIYALGLGLDDVAFELAEATHPLAGSVSEAIGSLNQIMRDLRGYIMNLRPQDLAERGLEAAALALAKSVEDRSGLKVTVRRSFDPAELTDHDAINLWHILQEAFANIEKHANAAHVEVTLEAANGVFTLDVVDDGQGFDSALAGERPEGGGYGLANIRGRAEQLGGRCLIEATPGLGTRVHIEAPLRHWETA